ncbi:hypothetical protein [Ancylobacter radicis]|uniref:YARHG domain-containing protein n=1 Tax=Ancylobacter radicis TaxID=2836179 RepID=A0ABS5R8D2_9HYPH|nr:hypothetical protein [Ancylobacter radicis]MBS9477933.1 hypothetical protein [Ancylobacter radicis]
MTKLLFPLLSAGLLLGGALLLPRLTAADANAEAAETKGYRTCFLERSFVAEGTPRLETKRRCVFEE